MCRTTYKWYSKCKCIYIGEHPVCCPNFASSHPESLDRLQFKPKLLTRTHKGLDMDLSGLSFMSADVDNQRAPKGLTCPDIIAYVQIKPAAEGCPLCENPHVLAAVHKQQAKGQCMSVGTSGWKPTQKPVCEMASTGSGSVLRKEDPLQRDQGRKQPGLFQITRTNEPASRLVGGSKTKATQTKSQTSATRAPGTRTDLTEVRGHRQNASDSSTSSGGYPSSIDFNLCAGNPPYWDPLAD